MTPWFKLWTSHLPVFEAVSDEMLGKAIRAALLYCQTEEVPQLDPMTNLLFVLLRRDIEDAKSKCQVAAENGKRAMEKRWKNVDNKSTDGITGDKVAIDCYADDSKPNHVEAKSPDLIPCYDGDIEGKKEEVRKKEEKKEEERRTEGKDARKGAKKALGRKAAPDWQSMMAEYPFSPAVREAILEWLRYKSERREPYRTQGLRSLLRQLDASCHQYGDDAVVQLIGQCMASGWKGLIFDRLSTASPAKPTGPRQPDEQERQAIARMMRQVE